MAQFFYFIKTEKKRDYVRECCRDFFFGGEEEDETNGIILLMGVMKEGVFLRDSNMGEKGSWKLGRGAKER